MSSSARTCLRVLQSIGITLAMAASATSAQPARTGPYLRWNLAEATSAPDEPLHQLCGAVSVSWVDSDDQVVWTRELPARMREVDRGLCDCRRADDGGPCAAELRDYRARPRAAEPPFAIGVVRAEEVVAVADASGLLFLRVSTGEVLLDWAAPSGPPLRTPPLFVDEGRFALEGEPGCAGPVLHGRALTRCGGHLVYFNGTDVALFSLEPLRLVAVADGNAAAAGSRGHLEARLPLGRWVFVLTGRIFFR